ncbi:hypothetical protein AAVH_27114 [Aphelenchoides avenae]|nr:hypothetical protein AAVH_27114 [Aphelenchus avenae]
MNFGLSYTGQETTPCAVCRAPVKNAEKVVVDRETIHKECFICGYCDKELKHGACALIKTSMGKRWFCRNCALLDPSERQKKLRPAQPPK